jgi:hypothetical protein
MRPEIHRHPPLITVLLCLIVLFAPVSVSADTAIQGMRIEGSGPIMDPAAAFWDRIPATKVRMVAQMVVKPRHPQPSVKELSVRAVHNDGWVGLLLEWEDATRDDMLHLDSFGDQAAVQFPVSTEATPSPMMGNPGGRVNVMQWRAALQRDIESGELDIKDLYPNALIDVYPDQVMKTVEARAYTGALGLDNPVSRPHVSAVLDQMSEGWGTMTVKPVQHADGWGIWEDGTWRVVITRPLFPVSPSAPNLVPGTRTLVAFAVWDGSNREVGARKSWSNWVAFEVAK